MGLSVTIITLNEEQNLERALKSVQFADEVVIIDSFSQDQTKAVAEKYAARFIQKEFLGYGQQKNLAMAQCREDWVLNIDADEEVSPQLQEAIIQTINKKDPAPVYALNRLNQFCGKWIRHGGWSPDFQARLCLKDKANWTEPEVHERLIPLESQKVEKLSGLLYHYSFPSFSSQVERNLKYARLGAKNLIRQEKPASFAQVLGRPLVKFMECYVLKKGFLDGKEGLVIALNASYSMFMKYTFSYYKKFEK